MSNLFQRVQGLNPYRSAFDLSYDKKFTCDMGELVPVMCDEAVPGDIWKISNKVIVRLQPLLAPILHKVDIIVHYFFVPYRLLWDEWEDFITGGVDGELTPVLPRWTPPTGGYLKGSLWDYFGFPVGIVPTGAIPLDFPRSAYNFIFNEYYRDQTIDEEVLLTNDLLLNRRWPKDYFTSSLPFQQRGISPSIPLTGTAPVLGLGFISTTFDGFTYGPPSPGYVTDARGNNQTWENKYGLVNESGTSKALMLEANGPDPNSPPNIRADLSVAETFDIAQLRLAFQIQKFLERNARCGARYVEFVKAHFGNTGFRDDRAQRPEYIGGTMAPLFVSEVVQTSPTGTYAETPIGTLAGHGIGVSDEFAASYRVPEFGLIMGIMSVVPKAAYHQGIDRQWLRQTKYDFYFPEFQNLSEQAIIQAEIYAEEGDSVANNTIFGFQGRYDEMRVKQSQICSEMRDTFDYWHLGRDFTAAPTLSPEFLTCIPSKRIFAVQDEDGLIVNFGNRIKAIRPLPMTAEPGLIDHN